MVTHKKIIKKEKLLIPYKFFYNFSEVEVEKTTNWVIGETGTPFGAIGVSSKFKKINIKQLHKLKNGIFRKNKNKNINGILLNKKSKIFNKKKIKNNSDNVIRSSSVDYGSKSRKFLNSSSPVGRGILVIKKIHQKKLGNGQLIIYDKKLPIKNHSKSYERLYIETFAKSRRRYLKNSGAQQVRLKLGYLFFKHKNNITKILKTDDFKIEDRGYSDYGKPASALYSLVKLAAILILGLISKIEKTSYRVPGGATVGFSSWRNRKKFGFYAIGVRGQLEKERLENA